MKRLFRKRWFVFLSAVLCCVLWGSAFPCVKLGLRVFGVDTGYIPDQVVFAGIRFTLAGIFVVIIGSLQEHKFLFPRLNEIPKVLKLCVFQTILQYSLYYIAMVKCSGVNASVVDSLADFLVILCAALVFRMEKLTVKKVVGCILGVIGVLVINMSPSGFDFNMSFMGEGFILLSGMAYAVSVSLTKKYSKSIHPVMLAGYQFIAGGLALLGGGFALGGRIRQVTPKGILLLAYLVFISTFAYTVWTVLLKYNDVSTVAIYGFLIPVIGVISSVIVLGETEALSIKYLIALIIVCTGIALINAKKFHPKKHSLPRD